MEKTCVLPLGGKLRFCCEVPEEDLKGVVIICPGGAYARVSERESEPVARRFSASGWLGVILDYAVGDGVLGTLPMRQLGEALEYVRGRFPGKKAVICGFSAGGHLALSLGVHYKDAGLLRPDALILCYPVVTAGEYAHHESIWKLSGDGDQSYYSLENFVTADMPPAFIWHTLKDDMVPVENSLLLADAMQKAGVPYELLLFPTGVHGLSLATKEVEQAEKKRYADDHIARWPDMCISWLDEYIAAGKF